MAKKIKNYCLFGAPAGIAAYVLFTLWGSFMRGDGRYYFTSGHLIRMYGNEVNAVAAACISAALVGMIWSASSLIYRETDWNLLKQTVIHCFICVVPSLVISYLMYWMPRNMIGLIQYTALFAVLYVLNWTAQYLGMKKRVKQINQRIHDLMGS